MDRRRFGRLIVGSLVIAPLAGRAQTATGVRRLGFLSTAAPGNDDEIKKHLAALRKLGWIEGRNIVVQSRFTAGREALPTAAQELVRLKVELIITDGTLSALAAKNATTTIPIVMASVGDPVAMGIVASLSRPGGNITGYSIVSVEKVTKRAALLHELLPAAQRVALVVYSDNPLSRVMAKEAEAAYRGLGVQTIFIEPASVEDVLGDAVRRQAQALDAPYLGREDAIRFIEVAMRYRLPVMGSGREAIEAGAVMSFEMDTDDQARRVAAIIDKILRGARPADIPIEQPTRFELLINLRSAKALGIEVPPSLLLRADEVIR
jgi:putative tryptophan/tyrosine transport system substrate-binding protein